MFFYQIGILLPKQYEIGKNMLIPSLSTHIISTKQYEKKKAIWQKFNVIA